jgi:asparagine synthase (glutamine-hydrolysing)
MCGIGGIVLQQPGRLSEAPLQSMIDAMRSRGPDDSGMFISDHVGLVHTRLAVRDLSSSAKCPMHSPGGEASIVFNGEIYNWRELRHSLERAGYQFHTQSDTEVLLHGYLRWGNGPFSRLRGMFALAIWDTRSQSLLLARDRAGEKPLFYAEGEDALCFASSPRLFDPLLQGSHISPVAVACYLAHSFIPAPLTIYREVFVLPPAHYLTVSVGRGSELRRYWDFPKSAPEQLSAVECERTIEACLSDIVARCLDADVPVGLFLSGGVDSSLVAALATRHRRNLPAFTIGFKETALSEVPYAQRVARLLGLEHHVSFLTPEDVIEWLPYLVNQYGQPFGDSSALPTYALARLARQHVTVCLCGDGGDESFAGYWRAQSTVYAARYGRFVPRFVRQRIVPFLASILGNAGRRWGALHDLSLQPPAAGTQILLVGSR